MEDFGLENIMSDFDIENLFDGQEDSSDVVTQDSDNDTKDAKTETANNIDVNPDELFGGLQESVDDGGDDAKTGEGAEQGASPNFYSSILEALYNDGSLPELSDDMIKNVNTDEDFREVFETIVNNRVDAKTRRIEMALDSGADIDSIKQYEGIINTLQSLTEEQITSEGRQGEDIRRRIIAQDLKNRGFTPERIQKELKKTFDAGTDIDDAKEALEANLQYYTRMYNDIIERGKETQRQYKENTRRQSEQLRNSIIEKDQIFDQIGIDKKTRQRIYDNVSKPKKQDQNGNWYTEIQDYQMNNPIDFLKYVSMFYTMTDGFKNIDKVVGKSVQKEKKSFVKDLEKKLSTSTRTQTGKLNYIGHGDPENEYLGNFILDI